MKWTKQPRIDRKTKKQIGWRYEFWRYNPALRRYDRVPVCALPENGLCFTNDQQADEYVRLKSAEEDAIKARIEQLLAWETKFQDIRALVELFAEQQKLSAPNSWENDVHYLSTYALSFFLNEKKANNILNWHVHFDEFKKWLQTVRPLKAAKSQLAYNTMNRIIKATNKFLEFNAKRAGTRVIKCEVFPREKLKNVGAADIPDELERKKIMAALKDIRSASYDLYCVISNSGLRINEALGLCLAFLFEGKIDGPKSKKIDQALEKYGLGNYFGYICLESQPKLKQIRSDDGSVPRKPLKLRRSISPKYFRYMPIADAETWNILVERYETSMALYDSKVHGSNPRDYLLFDGLTASKFYRDLAKAYERCGLKFKSPHKLRHAYLTPFYDRTCEDQFLAETVGGHRDRKMIENYSHIAEQIGLEQKAKAQLHRRLRKAN